jgi:hypothetical protein
MQSKGYAKHQSKDIIHIVKGYAKHPQLPSDCECYESSSNNRSLKEILTCKQIEEKVCMITVRTHIRCS